MAEKEARLLRVVPAAVKFYEIYGRIIAEVVIDGDLLTDCDVTYRPHWLELAFEENDRG